LAGCTTTVVRRLTVWSGALELGGEVVTEALAAADTLGNDGGAGGGVPVVVIAGWPCALVTGGFVFIGGLLLCAERCGLGDPGGVIFTTKSLTTENFRRILGVL